MLWFTLWQAAASTLIALLLATPTAYALYKSHFLGSNVVASLIVVPFILPTIVVAIGIKSMMTGSLTFSLLFANVFMNYGFASRIIGTAWIGLDPGIEEAARLDGAGKLQTFFSITIFALSNAYKSAALLVFLYCTANFGLVLIIGGGRLHSLETEIYSSATQILNLPKAASYVALQSVLTLMVLLFMSQRTSFAAGLTNGRSRLRSTRRELPVILFSLVIAGLVVLGPIADIVKHAFATSMGIGLGNFLHLNSLGARNTLSISLGEATLNSLRNAAISTCVAMGIGLYLASAKRSLLLLTLYRIPIGISTVALGLGYLVTFTSGIFPFRQSWLVTPIAQSILLIPLVVQIVMPSQRAISEDIENLATMEGADRIQYWWYIERPILMRSILVALGYVVVISIGEFGAANFLAYGDQATLPTLLYRLISRPGSLNFGMAMAASALLIALTAIITFAVDFYSLTRDRL